MAQATTTKTDDRIALTTQGDTLIVDITSPSGIGEATLQLMGAQRPKAILLRFHLKGLEELRFEFDTATVLVSISSSQGNLVTRRVTQAAATKEETVAVSGPYWMNTRLVPAAGAPATIPLQEGVIEVTAPDSFVKNPLMRFTLRWIDFYR